MLFKHIFRGALFLTMVFAFAAWGIAQQPIITNFTPSSTPAGGEVTITGTNFTGATSVTFGGTAAGFFHVDSDTSISTTIAIGTTAGPVSVTTPGGTATTHGYFTCATPITAVSLGTPTPASPVNVGTPVTLTATVTDGSATPDYKFFVEFQTPLGVAQSMVIQDYSTASTCIWAPTVAANYTVVVEAREHLAPAPYAAICALKFLVTDAPTITSFTPTSGAPYSIVTITGTNFTSPPTVSFNGVSALFSWVNSTTITARVPAGANSGQIKVVTQGGTAITTVNFTVLAPVVPAPTITSFSKTPGAGFDTVNITGTNFNNVSSVKFGGTAAFSIILWSPTLISAKVGLSNAYKGLITVTTPGGTATSATEFTP